MRLGSACSGIGCIDLGLERAGFEPAWQIEWDKFPRSVLEEHWPDVQRYRDLSTVNTDELAPVDLIAGGTPCQDLSVAGQGAGLDGERSGLFFDFVRLVDSQPSSWVLWENVPGALSSNAGADFSRVLEGFTGYRPEPADRWRKSGWCIGPKRWAVWRVLDAQYFGVAQRRRRLFVVAGPRDCPSPQVLLEPDSGSRNPREGEAKREVTATLGGSSPTQQRLEEPPVVNCLTASNAKQGNGAETLLVGSLTTNPGRGYDGLVASSLTASQTGGRDSLVGQLVVDEVQLTSHENRSNPLSGDPVPTLSASSRPLVFAVQAGVVKEHGDLAPALVATCTDNQALLANKYARRLTPLERERVMGLPDGWTQRLSAARRAMVIGNGAAVPVLEWIGRRVKISMSPKRLQ